MAKDDLTKAERKWRNRSLFQRRRSNKGAILAVALIIVVITLLATGIYSEFSLRRE